MDLVEKRCRPCEGGVAPLGEAEARRYLDRVQGWSLIDGKRIRREWRLRDFKEAWGFANQVALLAEEEAHHPDIRVVYSWVRIELTTHSIQGLSENDFIMAAKIDRLRPS